MHDLTLHSIVIRSLNDIMRIIPKQPHKSRNIVFECTYRLRGAWGVDMDESPVDPLEGVMPENVWLYWRKYERALAVLWAVFPVRRESDVHGGGDLQHFQPEGDVPGAWEGFIHIAKPSLIVGAERRTKRKQGTEVLSGPVHSIARHKWQPKVGRERDEDRDPKGESARRSDLSPLYRDRSRIAFIREYRESDSHGSFFYKSTIEIVPFKCGSTFVTIKISFLASYLVFFSQLYTSSLRVFIPVKTYTRNLIF